MIRSALLIAVVLLQVSSAIYGAEENASLVPTPGDGISCYSLLSTVETPPTAQRNNFLTRFLPEFVYSRLAKSYAGARRHRIEDLNRQLAELVAPEAMRFMAQISQTSHAYLVHELPETAEGAAEGKRRVNKRQKIKGPLEPSMERLLKKEAHEEAWINRVARASKILVEIGQLQRLDSEGEPLLRAMTDLQLAILDGFSHGFTGIFSTGPGGPGREMIDSATERFEQSIKVFEDEFGKDSDVVLLLRFLLGKHAKNGLIANANAGYIGLEPEPAFNTYRDIAMRELEYVIQRIEPRLRSEPYLGPSHELYFESLYHLIEVRDERRIEPDDTRKLSPKCTGKPESLEGILIEAIRIGGREWVERQLSDYQYSLLYRLHNSIRWGYQGVNQSPELDKKNKVLYVLEEGIRAGKLTYEEYVGILIRKLGYTGLPWNPTVETSLTLEAEVDFD